MAKAGLLKVPTSLSFFLLSLVVPTIVGAAPPVNNPDTFVYAITGDIDSLDPHWEYDAISQEVQLQLYEGLIFYKGSSVDAFEPMLSTLVPDLKNGLLSADGLRYAFPIRKDVRFHDGTPLSPEDVKYSLMRFLFTDRASGPSFLLLGPLLGVDSLEGLEGPKAAALFDEAQRAVTIEAGALVLKLRRPYAPLLSVLAGFCPIVSRPWTIARGGWDGEAGTWIKHRNPLKQDAALYDKVNGTGPFMLERWDKENKSLTLVRNETYWRSPAALKRVVFKTVNEPALRKLMLQTGDADAAMMERQYLPQVAGLEGVSVTDDLPLLEAHNVFIMNFKIDPRANSDVGSGRLDGGGIAPDFFSDPEVRRGFAYAFDYDAYLRDGYRGKGSRARGPIPKGIFGYNDRQTVVERDPARAEKHFRAAWGGKIWEKGFRFTLSYMEGRADRQLACQIMKKTVEALNPKFKIDVRAVQWSTWLSAFSAGKLPMTNARWALDFPDPHNAVFAFLHSDGYYAKNTGYANPRADRLIDQAKVELERDRRRQQYAELQAIAAADLPAIFTLDTFNFHVTRSWVRGFYYNPIMPYGYLYTVSKEQP